MRAAALAALGLLSSPGGRLASGPAAASTWSGLLPSRPSLLSGSIMITMAEPPPPEAAAAAASTAIAEPEKDWGGLPAAITASQAGAINSQIVKTTDAEAVLSLTQKHHERLNSVNAATALHRIAQHLKRNRASRDRVLRDSRFLALIDTAAERAPQCNPRSVSDMLWAFATLQHWPPSMLKPLLTRVAIHLEANAFEAQHLALIVWAFAVLELKPVKLLERIEQCAVSQLKSLNQQNCANILWGFAKLNYKPETLLPHITAKMAKPDFLSHMKPVEISDASFGLALVGSSDAQGPLMAALAGRVTPDHLLPSFTSRQLVTLTWAFAKMNTRPTELGHWLERVKADHAQQPLLAQDQKNIKAALGRFDEDVEWLSPPTAAQVEEAAESEKAAAAAAEAAEAKAAATRDKVMGRTSPDSWS